MVLYQAPEAVDKRRGGQTSQREGVTEDGPSPTPKLDSAVNTSVVS